MDIWRSMAGMVTAELTSADIPAALRRISELGIQLFEVQMHGDLSARFTVCRKDYRALRALASKRGDTLKLLRRKGIYWDLKGLLRRPVLLGGMALLLALALILPGRVLFIQIEGNSSLPDRLILAAAEDSGIRFGASRRAVRSEKMKNALLSEVPQLQWAGVNTYGCVAVISVRERAETEKAEDEEPQVGSIVAARDGVILSCTVTRGNGLCTVGQAVQAGDVLISGYTDCGLTVTATKAEGEILAETRRDLTVKMPASQESRGQSQSQTTKFSLIIGKKRINFYKGSGISDASCVKMYSEYVLTLPGGFELPVKLVRETVSCYDCQTADIEEPDASRLLSDFASRYLQGRMVAGQILERREDLTRTEGAYCLTGEYACTEMIGREAQEQIGEYHGKTD